MPSVGHPRPVCGRRPSLPLRSEQRRIDTRPQRCQNLCTPAVSACDAVHERPVPLVSCCRGGTRAASTHTLSAQRRPLRYWDSGRLGTCRREKNRPLALTSAASSGSARHGTTYSYGMTPGRTRSRHRQSRHRRTRLTAASMRTPGRPSGMCCCHLTRRIPHRRIPHRRSRPMARQTAGRRAGSRRADGGSSGMR